MKRILFILFTFGLFMQMQAQTINLAKSHNPSKEPVIYIVDFLQLDSLLMSSIAFQRDDIKSTKTEGSTVIVITILLVILNETLLSTPKEKKENLSTIKKDIILSIERVDKKRAVELYGQKGKNGALLIKTKNKIN